jgi:DNA-3-methyladenine glycosylase II
MIGEPLTEPAFGRALAELGRWDPDIEAVVATHGPPPMWARQPGFATLVHIILEQQVSLASAKAAFDRLLAAVGTLTPAALLERNRPPKAVFRVKR